MSQDKWQAHEARTGPIKDGTMHVQAGAGIVAGFHGEFERQECIDKAQALFRAAAKAKRFAGARRRAGAIGND